MRYMRGRDGVAKSMRRCRCSTAIKCKHFAANFIFPHASHESRSAMTLLTASRHFICRQRRTTAFYFFTYRICRSLFASARRSSYTSFDAPPIISRHACLAAARAFAGREYIATAREYIITSLRERPRQSREFVYGYDDAFRTRTPIALHCHHSRPIIIYIAGDAGQESAISLRMREPSRYDCAFAPHAASFLSAFYRQPHYFVAR